jgi:hypothetical protein
MQKLKRLSVETRHSGETNDLPMTRVFMGGGGGGGGWLEPKLDPTLSAYLPGTLPDGE